MLDNYLVIYGSHHAESVHNHGFQFCWISPCTLDIWLQVDPQMYLRSQREREKNLKTSTQKMLLCKLNFEALTYIIKMQAIIKGLAKKMLPILAHVWSLVLSGSPP